MAEKFAHDAAVTSLNRTDDTPMMSAFAEAEAKKPLLLSQKA
jgi:hypothetical protein